MKCLPIEIEWLENNGIMVYRSGFPMSSVLGNSFYQMLVLLYYTVDSFFVSFDLHWHMCATFCILLIHSHGHEMWLV